MSLFVEKQSDPKGSSTERIVQLSPVPSYGSKEEQIRHIISWNALKFPTKHLNHPVFEVEGTDKILYCIDYNKPHNDGGGIFEYDIKSDTHKTIVLWETTNFYPSGCQPIYNPSQNEMLFVGGYDYYPQCHKHPFITIYNMTNNQLRKNEIKIEVAQQCSLSGARLALTNNDKFLHIVGGQNNGSDFIVNLLTKVVRTKPNNIYPFRSNDYDYGVVDHELIYHKAENQLIMVGGCASTRSRSAACCQYESDYNTYFDFWTFDLNDMMNNTWKQHKKQKQIKYQQFTAVLYDNRVVIAFGGYKWSDYRDVSNGQLDDIYYMDLYGDAEWNKANVKCPKSGNCNVVIVNNIVHIMPWYGYDDHFYIKISDLLPAKLLNKTAQNEMKQDIQSKDDNKEAQHDALKDELVTLMNKMNEFNKKYDEKELTKIFESDPYSLFVEQEIEDTKAICKATLKHLEDIQQYVVSVTKPDVNAYESWDMNTTIVWIRSLDEGCYVKYCDALRKGFESDGIEAVDLPNIGQADLATDPFNIRAFRDRKKLSQHFQALQQKAAAMDGPNVTAYI
eukprot:890802_1